MSGLKNLLYGTNISGPGNRLWNWAEKVSAAVDSGGITSVTSITVLEELNTYDLSEGLVIFTSDVRDFWQLFKDSTEPSDGITVVAATPAGRWVRLGYPSPTWQSQTDWYIDPVGGSDTAAGSVEFPLKTWAEFRRRTLDGFVPGAQVYVYLLDDLPATDPLVLDWRTATPNLWTGLFQQYATLTVSGIVKSTLVSGVVTAFTARNAALNTPDTLDATDGTDPIDWADLLSTHPEARIRFTSGTAFGSVAYPMQSLAPGQARVSRPWDGVSFSVVTPSAADTFAVETLSQVGTLQLGKGGFLYVLLQDVWLSNNTYGYDDGAYDTANIYYQQVVADTFYQRVSSLVLFNCLATSAVEAPGGASTYAGGARGNVNLSSGVSVLDQGFYVQGHYIALSAINRYQNSYTTCYVLDACVFDSPGDAMTCVGSAALQIDFDSVFYGAGNSGYGVNLGLTGRIYGIQYSSGYTLKVTGTSGDVGAGTLGAKAWTDPLPWLDPNSFAGAV